MALISPEAEKQEGPVGFIPKNFAGEKGIVPEKMYE
jgi:hypothetical protein